MSDQMSSNLSDNMSSGTGEAGIGTAALQGAGQYAMGIGQAAAYSANARFARQEAGVARQQSYLKAAAVDQLTGKVAGEQRAAFGRSGVAPNLWVLSDTAHRGAMEREMQLYQGKLEATKAETQADIYHAEATSANLGGIISGTATVLESIAKAATAGA
jgi:hypothetical protein